MLKFHLKLAFRPFMYENSAFLFCESSEAHFYSPLQQDQKMFQRKDSTGHECVKTVPLWDEATARVYSFLNLILFSYDIVNSC